MVWLKKSELCGSTWAAENLEILDCFYPWELLASEKFAIGTCILYLEHPALQHSPAGHKREVRALAFTRSAGDPPCSLPL